LALVFTVESSRMTGLRARWVASIRVQEGGNGTWNVVAGRSSSHWSSMTTPVRVEVMHNGWQGDFGVLQQVQGWGIEFSPKSLLSYQAQVAGLLIRFRGCRQFGENFLIIFNFFVANLWRIPLTQYISPFGNTTEKSGIFVDLQILLMATFRTSYRNRGAVMLTACGGFPLLLSPCGI
jgi:hypothetical protein